MKFDLSTVAKQATESIPTKRNTASIAAKFYDPIGFLSPVVVQFKLFFQELCESKTNWDDILEGDLLIKWNKLVSSLRDVQPFWLERCYFKEPWDAVVCCNLHGFCDASLKAYGAVVYLQVQTTSQVYTKFVASKTRVAPLSNETIPRLELLAAVILARLVSAVKVALEHEVPFKKITCWSDSEIALCWIKGIDKEWKQFVQNRVIEIRRLLPVDCWRYCSTDSNPADIPSRGMNASQLASSALWLSGPPWLSHYKEDSIESSAVGRIPDECLAEMTMKNQEQLKTLTFITNTESRSISSLIDLDRFSNLQRLLRVTAYVLRFVKNLKERLKGGEQVFESDIGATDLKEAEQCWISDAQRSLRLNKKFES